jgi:hypothetical protein
MVGSPPTYGCLGPVIKDGHQLSLPPDLEPGTYAPGMGLYPSPDSSRLPTVTMDGVRLQDDRTALPSFVTVRW